MQNTLLYMATVLIWGSTWYVIKFQLDGAVFEVSVGLRFGLAGVLLFAWAALQRKSVAIRWSHYGWVIAQGAMLYCINYVLVYTGTATLTSGLVAVMFALIIPFNLIHERLFFKRPFETRVALAAIIGIAGIVLIFLPEIRATDFDLATGRAMVIVLLAVWLASLGNMLAIRNMRYRYSVVALNAHSMVWASLMTLGYAAAIGEPLTVHWTTDYAWSLFYLSVFGSAIAFGCYLMLIERIGSSRAAYTAILYPVVALVVSAIFESYRPEFIAAVGLALAIFGNVLIIKRKPVSVKIEA